MYWKMALNSGGEWDVMCCQEFGPPAPRGRFNSREAAFQAIEIDRARVLNWSSNIVEWKPVEIVIAP